MNGEQIRAEFENWWKQELSTKHGLTIDDINTYCKRSPKGDYVHATTAMRWEGWQAALSAKSVPDGYVLVPIEPTEAMCRKGAAHTHRDNSFTAMMVYQAMLAAAPQAPTDDERVRELESVIKEFVNNAYEHDCGGGDFVVTTCEALEKAKEALASMSGEQK